MFGTIIHGVRNMTSEEFIIECKKRNITISPEMMEQFILYADLLKEWNAKMNLTAIDEREEVFEKHFFDSILPLNDSIQGKIADVGTGAGFPGIVWKIVRPDLDVSLIEPTGKRCKFLEEVISQLKLENIHVYNERSEEHVKQHREEYDVVTARAVANLRVLSELCCPLVKKDGIFLTMKGSHGDEEVLEAKNAIDKLGMKLTSREETSLTNGDPRQIFTFKKIKETPMMYPRNYGQIKKKPL